MKPTRRVQGSFNNAILNLNSGGNGSASLAIRNVSVGAGQININYVRDDGIGVGIEVIAVPAATSITRVLGPSGNTHLPSTIQLIFSLLATAWEMELIFWSDD